MEHRHIRLASNIRQALKFIIPLFAVALVFGGVLAQQIKVQKVFLFETYRLLAKVEHGLQRIIEPSYTDIESFTACCNKLVFSLVELEITISNGHMFVSDEIPVPDPLHGLSPITEAIQENIGIDPMEDDFSGDFISEEERMFLIELLDDVTKLKDVCNVSGSLYVPAALSKLKETYESFSEKWQHDGYRTPSGTSPFDRLNS